MAVLAGLILPVHAAQVDGDDAPDRHVVAEVFVSRVSDIATRGISMRYRMAADGVRFRHTGPMAASMRQDWWKLQEPCAALSAEGLATLATPCAFATLTIRPGRHEQDRVYPPSVPLGGRRAALIHTSYIEPEGRDEDLIALIPPADGVMVVNGRLYTDRITVPLSAFRNRYVYAGEAPAEHENGVLYANFGFGADVHAAVKKVLSHAAKTLQFDRLGIDEIAVFEDFDPDAARFAWRGDVTPGGMVRLSLFATDGKGADEVVRMAAHELVHLAEGGGELPNEEVDPWLSEGNAEFISWLILVGAGGGERAAAASKVESALNHCLALIGSSAWTPFTHQVNGRVPYDCGLVLHLAAATTGPDDPVGFWIDRFASSHGLDIGAFDAFAGKTCKVAQRSALVCADDGVGVAITRVLAEAGLLAGLLPQEMAGEYARTVTRAFVRRAMAEACDGNFGFSFDGEIVATDALAGCQPFRTAFTFNAISGVALSDHAALQQRVSSVCARGEPLVLQDNGAAKATLACPAELEPWPVFHRIDARRLDAYLEKWVPHDDRRAMHHRQAAHASTARTNP